MSKGVSQSEMLARAKERARIKAIDGKRPVVAAPKANHNPQLLQALSEQDNFHAFSTWPNDMQRVYTNNNHPKRGDRLKLVLFLMGNGMQSHHIPGFMRRWKDFDELAWKDINELATRVQHEITNFIDHNAKPDRSFFFYDVLCKQLCYLDGEPLNPRFRRKREPDPPLVDWEAEAAAVMYAEADDALKKRQKKAFGEEDEEEEKPVVVCVEKKKEPEKKKKKEPVIIYTRFW